MDEFKTDNLPHFCPICGAEMHEKNEIIDGDTIVMLVCDECGYQEPVD